MSDIREDFERLHPESVKGMKYVKDDDGWEHYVTIEVRHRGEYIREAVVTKMFSAFKAGAAMQKKKDAGICDDLAAMFKDGYKDGVDYGAERCGRAIRSQT